jgi:hypothetical protein
VVQVLACATGCLSQLGLAVYHSWDWPFITAVPKLSNPYAHFYDSIKNAAHSINDQILIMKENASPHCWQLTANGICQAI